MKGLGRITQGEKEQMLAEPSVSRVWQLINDPDVSFAVVSASLDESSDLENRKRHEELEEEILGLGYDYVEIISGYSHVDGDHIDDDHASDDHASDDHAGNGDNERAFAEKRGFVIPEISKEDAMGLATDHDQSSILWKDGTAFVLLSTCKDAGIGKVMARFSTEPSSSTFEPESVRDAFSALGGSETEFAFIAERAVHDFPTRMMYADAKTLRGDWIVVL